MVKYGGEAALVTQGHKTFHLPTEQFIGVVDATGAGDSINEAYLAARIPGANITEAAGK